MEIELRPPPNQCTVIYPSISEGIRREFNDEEVCDVSSVLALNPISLYITQSMGSPFLNALFLKQE